MAVENLDRPCGRRLVGAGVSVFVTDAFVEETFRIDRPYPALRLLELWADDRPCVASPSLLHSGQGTRGLNLFLIHHGWPDD